MKARVRPQEVRWFLYHWPPKPYCEPTWFERISLAYGRLVAKSVVPVLDLIFYIMAPKVIIVASKAINIDFYSVHV